MYSSGTIEIPVLRRGSDLSSVTSVWCATRPSDPPSASPGVDYIPSSKKVEFKPGRTQEVRTETPEASSLVQDRFFNLRKTFFFYFFHAFFHPIWENFRFLFSNCFHLIWKKNLISIFHAFFIEFENNSDFYFTLFSSTLRKILKLLNSQHLISEIICISLNIIYPLPSSVFKVFLGPGRLINPSPLVS